DDDLIDGEIACKVINIMNENKSWSDPRGSANGCEKLELAFIYFFQQFRKSYIGENSQKVSKSYNKLSELLGINDQTMLLELIVTKIILFVDDNVDRDFDEFVKPWDITMTELGTLNSLQAFRQPAVKTTLSGIFRDLRGFLSAIQSRKNFLLLFEWFYPNHMQILYHALEAWFDDELAITILKFFHEFVSNRTRRLDFDISSPNGILLFRETR
ncbi:15848_t:CDS:2, partial [Acaulospora colombiana]